MSQSASASQDDRSPDAPPPIGLAYRVARTVDEVVDAWRLVYHSYRHVGLIRANPARLHTAPQAVNPNATIVVGRIGGITVSTLTAIVDSPELGLPVDRVFPDALDDLRREGRLVMEFSLFADRREELARTTEALVELMRHMYHLGVQQKVTDYVMAVQPRHARYYARTYGFEPMGDMRRYTAVNDRPVVLLRGDFAGRFESEHEQYSVYRYFKRCPVDPAAFADRFDFSPQHLAGSVLERWQSLTAAQRCEGGPASSAA